MKIFKDPRLEPTTFICQNCGCKYEAVYGEYCVWQGWLKMCRCPVCQSRNEVSNDEQWAYYERIF